MPEVVRGSRASLDQPRNSIGARVHFGPDTPNEQDTQLQHLDSTSSQPAGRASISRRTSEDPARPLQRRQSSKYEDRETADVYYDSRAATKHEFKRRATTLSEYYRQNPNLLPQLPFTWKHGWKRWKLFGYIGLIFIDACAIPIILYYTLNFVGNVQGYIIFAVVATIWGGPTYVDFAVRSWRLIKKENFFRPLGSQNRWAFDYVHWVSSIAIAAVTVFLIVGSAPHIVFLRILSLPGPALLLVLGVAILWVTVYHVCGWKAPFRLSSTAKGEPVKPGVFYIIEDVVAVNAGAGRPYREALTARYEASPMFRQLMRDLSWAWCVPSIAIAIVLIVLICIHPISIQVAYGIGWGVPFLWMGIWGIATVPYCKWYRRKERDMWESNNFVDEEKKLAQVESTPPSETENSQSGGAAAAQQISPPTTATTSATSPSAPSATAIPDKTKDTSSASPKNEEAPSTPEPKEETPEDVAARTARILAEPPTTTITTPTSPSSLPTNEEAKAESETNTQAPPETSTETTTTTSETATAEPASTPATKTATASKEAEREKSSEPSDPSKPADTDTAASS